VFSVLAGDPAFWPNPATPAKFRPLWPESGTITPESGDFCRMSPDSGLINLSDSDTDWSRNLACRNPAIVNCLNEKNRLLCLKERRLHLPSTENDLRIFQNLLNIFGQMKIIFRLTIIFAPTKHRKIPKLFF
jgi:hypothetical protein